MAKRQQPLLWPSSRAAFKKYDVNSRLHNCVIIKVYTQFTNVASRCITQSGLARIWTPLVYEQRKFALDRSTHFPKKIYSDYIRG